MSNYTYADLDSIDIKEDLNYYYEEVFLTKNKIFTYSNIEGFKSPYGYIVKKDSLFTGVGSNDLYFKFRAKIKVINKDEILLIDSLNRKGKLFRMIDKPTLDKFINFNAKYPRFEQQNIEYSQKFIDRSENYRLKFTKD